MSLKREIEMKKKKITIVSATCLLSIVTVWMMFQPLMGVYAIGEMASGEINVYGISFLSEFGAQGILTVIFPFFLMLLPLLQMEKATKTNILWILNLINIFAYAKSLVCARQWLTTTVGWNIEYHAGMIAYPFLVICLSIAVFLGMNQSDEDMDEEELEDV